MTTFDTYAQVGIKEDISDIITNISPTMTPFLSSIATEKVHNRFVQWQEDTLRATAANAQIEGGTPTDVTVSPTLLRNNYTQILWESVMVSDTANVVSTYGRARELAYQLAKSAKQVKRDLENALIGTAQASNAGASGTTGRSMAGYQTQLASATNSAGQAVPVQWAGAGNPLTETLLLTVLQTIYTNGADPSVIQVTPANAVLFASLAAASGSGRTRQIINGEDDRKIVNVVDVYVSPFGEQRVVNNRFMRTGNTIVYEPDMWALLVLRPWTREALAKVGDATRNMIVGEFSLKHKNFYASGAVVDHLATGF